MIKTIDNPMLKPAPRYDFNLAYSIVSNRCGCGRTAQYLVYEDKQPHCAECFAEAIDCDGQILVGRI